MSEEEIKTERVVKGILCEVWKEKEITKTALNQKILETTGNHVYSGHDNILNGFEVEEKFKIFLDSWNMENQQNSLDEKQSCKFLMLIKTVFILAERVSLNLCDFLHEPELRCINSELSGLQLYHFFKKLLYILVVF